MRWPWHKDEVGFLVASPRSGTTWFANLLSCHPEIHATELRLFGDFGDGPGRQTLDHMAKKMAMVARQGDLHPDLSNDFIAHMAGRTVEFFRSRSHKPVLVDKVTPYSHTSDLVLERLRTVFPGAPIIYLKRDGRDVMVSLMFHQAARRADRSEFARRRLQTISAGKPQALGRLFDDGEMDDFAPYWSGPARLFASESGHVLSYESMIEEPVDNLRGLLRYLGVGSSVRIAEACVERASFQNMSGGRGSGDASNLDHVRSGTVGEWRKYFTRRDAVRFHELAGAELIALGYESDDSWMDALPDRLP